MYQLYFLLPRRTEQDIDEQKRGAPVLAQRELFNRIIDELREDSDGESVTLESIQDDLKSRIEAAGYDEAPYTTKWIRRLLENEVTGVLVVRNFIIFEEKTEDLVKAHVADMKRKASADSKAKATVLNAARILRSKISLAGWEKDESEYFKLDDLTTDKQYDVVPELLRLFIEELYPPKAKKSKNTVAGLGQSLMKVTINRKGPMPLLMGLTVLSHKLTGSKALTQVNHQFGLGESYKELLMFNRNVAVMDNGQEEWQRRVAEFSDILAADNADANIETPSGAGSIHITGRIKATLDMIPVQTIYRRRVLTDEILNKNPVEVHHFYKNDIKVTTTFTDWVQPSISTTSPIIVDALRATRILYDPKTPLLAGTMRQVLSGNPPPAHGAHTVTPLPFIDMKSDDYTALSTVLLDAISRSRRRNMEPIIYFDQPLWLKSMHIKKSLDLPITILMGNFHHVMCFMSAIGYIMRGTGLEVILGKEFSATVVKDIMNGKNYRRCLRAHNLVSTSLKLKIIRQVMYYNTDHYSNFYNWHKIVLYIICSSFICLSLQIDPDVTSEANEVYVNTVEETGPVNLEDLANHPAVVRLLDSFNSLLVKLGTSRTNSLWIQYIRMVDILNSCIVSERIGM